eukprot:Gregarina_sp_Poly_1__10908@NODE_852_length_5963_cov_138_077510_g616_i0_p3_GENE_NODE_852_length_5963_cov_138_077510_g616_i0NODE_852_length_5963_cov_138_077510_g616_i0_p3_ORF_typecomplete_len408_score60_25Thioredoxin_6/PF13848_6/1_2e03Thioredoxin_6/PF13848_6/1_3e07ART/PF01129_18/0_21Stn1_C/PF12659_7/2_2e03Stn1_C/PF12659_7/9e02Stn1_C/PF12659_7/1_2_NODE_852_length_5963_cov_138_077510_g616_i0341224
MEGVITHLKAEQDVKTFEKEYDVAIIAYTNETGLRLFEEATGAMREIPQYGWVNISDASDKRFNTITVSKRGLADKLEAEIVSNVTAMQVWLLKAQMPLIGEISLSNIHAYLQDRRPYVWFVGLRNQFEGVRDSLYPITQQPEFLDKFWWVWLNPAQSEQTIHFIEDKLKPEKIPSFLLTDYEGPGRFYLRKPFPTIKAEDVADWLHSVIAGREKRELASEDVPSETYDPSSKLEKIVSKNVEAKLLRLKDAEREDEIILLALMPLCREPCTEMLSILTKMNEYLIQAQLDRTRCKLRVMSIDAYKNELNPAWNISVPRYPTVYFYPKVPAEQMSENAKATHLKPKVGKLEKHLYGGEIHEIDLWEWLKQLSQCDLGSLGFLKMPKKPREEGYDEL